MKMRVVYLCLAIVCVIGASSFGSSIGFSTGGENNYSWTVNLTGGTAVMSFYNNNVDASDPTPDTVLNDRIQLPAMTLSNIQKIPVTPTISIITANLTPADTGISLSADAAAGSVAAGDVVLSATLGTSSLLTVGTNFIAYSDPQDDIDIISYTAGYSAVLDAFAAADVAGYNVDLSFSGDTSAALNLYTLLDTMANGSVSGTLSGQIVAVPEPFTIGLLGMGGIALLRRRR